MTVSEDDIDDELMSVESDDSTVLNEAASENETITSGEDSGDEVLKGDSHVNGFYVMYIDTYVINSASSDVFTLYPNSAAGNLTVHVNGNETPVYNKVFTNTFKIQVTYLKTTKKLSVKVKK